MKIKLASDFHAKFGLPFSLAAALKLGRLGVEAFSDANITVSRFSIRTY